MIFHSANNLKKKRKKKKKEKKKEKERKEKERKRKERKEKKRGHKIISIKSPCNNSNLVHTFQAWPSSL
jgi:hypothetical protein